MTATAGKGGDGSSSSSSSSSKGKKVEAASSYSAYLDKLFAPFVYKGSTTNNHTPPIPTKTTTNNPIKKRKRKKKSSSTTFQPSSHLVTTINGERRVVSSYFPLPQGATPPIVLDRRDVLRAYQSRVNRQKKQEDLFAKHIEKVKSATPEELEEMDTREKLKHFRRPKQRSILYSREMGMDAYKRIHSGGASAWVPPPSPFRLLQEDHYFDPWRVLLICILLNLTTNTQVREVLDDLFARCPTAEAVRKVEEEELEMMLKPLGLYRKRARTIKIFSEQYLSKEWTHVTQLHGIGKYAADAYAIFCAGKAEEVIPQDHKLVDYWKFVCEYNEKQAENLCFDDAGP